MISTPFTYRSGGAALIDRWVAAIMDVILHLGAHRTGTTTFQHYMRVHQSTLAHQRIAFWGPETTRKRVLPGLFRKAGVRPRCHISDHTGGRVRVQMAQAGNAGYRRLIVSDENMIGSCTQNLQHMTLYPAIGERVARVAHAFGGRVSRVVMSIRAQDLWWTSACAFSVSRGHAVPSAARRDKICADRRTWRDAITDVACALPEADICIVPFEHFGNQPDKLLRTMIDGDAPPNRDKRWLNRSADAATLRKLLGDQAADPDQIPDTTGHWHPFSTEQCMALRENYADDLHWLTAGADGLATLTEDDARTRADTSLPPGTMTKGQTDDDGPGQHAHFGQGRL